VNYQKEMLTAADCSGKFVQEGAYGMGKGMCLCENG
jgi:hypothetical protein